MEPLLSLIKTWIEYLDEGRLVHTVLLQTSHLNISLLLRDSLYTTLVRSIPVAVVLGVLHSTTVVLSTVGCRLGSCRLVSKANTSSGVFEVKQVLNINFV